MRLTVLDPKFLAAQPILQTIEAAGYEAYFVGGSVRDALLKRPIHDVDIATSAYPAEVKALFKRTIDTGIKHGTVTVMDHGQGYEVTTFRTESTYQDYRRPDKVTFVRSLSEDLKRRDFTVNALAMTHDGQIIDLFSGLQDLQRHVLKAVGDPFERFHEDALRMMRAVRFEAQLNFDLALSTKQAISEHHHLLTKIAMERIHSEFVKMMLGQHWQVGCRDFIQTALYTATPVLAAHESALEKVPTYSGLLANEVQVWTFLAWCLGLTPDQCKQLLKAWKSANQVIDQTLRALQLCYTLQQTTTTPLWALYQSGAKAVTDGLAVLKLSQDITVQRQHQLQQAYTALPIKKAQDLAVNGGDLIRAGLKPGPELGRTLEALQKKVIAQTVANQASELLRVIKD